MAHFAMICPSLPSHLNAFAALGDALMRRGHRASFLVSLGADSSLGHAVIVYPGPSPVTGRISLFATIVNGARATEALCHAAPDLLRGSQVDAVLADQMEPGGGLVARHLGLPYLSVACALPIERDPAIAPVFVGWPHDASVRGRKRNRGGERVARLLLSPHRRVIRKWAARWRLGPLDDLQDCLSPHGTLSQTVAGLDFPRGEGVCIRHLGPFPASREERDLPFAPDPARPLVYASLGTLQGHRLGLFRAVAQACKAFGVQLVIAHCGGLTAEQAASLDADLVTNFVPQREVLAHAAVCVTHAGLNTTLEALHAGVPMLAVPIAFDQPGVAARIVYHGAGLKLSRYMLTARNVGAALAALLTEPAFRSNAARIGAGIRAAGGATAAAEIAEALLREKRPASLRGADAGGNAV